MQIAEYVRNREGEFFVGSTRVTLRSIIADWKRGRTPEQIGADFPSVSLVAIYGAITYYLEHQGELEAHFREVDATSAREKAMVEAAHAEFYTGMRERLARVRPSVQGQLREQGILAEAPDKPSEPEGPAEDSSA